MGSVKYLCRIVPGLSIILWSAVCWMALSGRLALPWSDKSNAKTDWHNLDAWQVMYIVYSILAHLSACLIFPVRLCYAVFQLTNEVRSAKFEAVEIISRQFDTESETSASSSISVDDKSSSLSIPISSASTLAGTPESSLSRVGTPKLSYFEDIEVPVTHAIILPEYKEDIGTLRETLLVLSSHALAKSSYDIYIATERRDPHGVSTAKVLIDQFQHSFKNISFTVHPDDIVGEVAGKSSNVSWAAKTLSHNYSDPLERRNTIITIMDSDTHFPASYFLLMTKAHRENPNSDMSLYTCPLCFDRNSHQVNPLVRTADIFWCGAGLSGMYRGSSVKIPTSVYSVAMPLAGRIGGWDTGPESIGEDMHTFLKAYFATKGKADTTIIFTPASQCNVSVESKGIKGFFGGVWARYNQAVRHMWGCLDTGFAVHKGLETFFKVESNSATWLSDPEPETRLDRWMDGVEHFSPPNLNLYDDPEPATFDKMRMVLLYHRLYEAHFLPAHLTVALFSAVIYTTWVPNAATHPVLLSAFSFCGTLRAIGMLLTCFYLYLYESYHKICVKYREDEMKKAGLYEDMKAADGFSHRNWRANWMDYLCLPATGMLFGTIPAVVAYVRHFYTDNLLYTVSAKPQVQRVADKLGAVADKVVSTADHVADKVRLDRLIDSVA